MSAIASGTVQKGSRNKHNRVQLLRPRRSIIERASPYKLAPGVHAAPEDEAGESSESEAEEAGLAVAPGTVFRLARGQLRKLELGMGEYEDIAARTAARLARARR